MRLIDADALIHELNNSHYPGAPYVDAGISIAIGKVCDAPTIEPERKTGKWESESESLWEDIWSKWKCSACDKHVRIRLYDDPKEAGLMFCPNCGATMEET